MRTWALPTLRPIVGYLTCYDSVENGVIIHRPDLYDVHCLTLETEGMKGAAFYYPAKTHATRM